MRGQPHGSRAVVGVNQRVFGQPKLSAEAAPCARSERRSAPTRSSPRPENGSSSRRCEGQANSSTGESRPSAPERIRFSPYPYRCRDGHPPAGRAAPRPPKDIRPSPGCPPVLECRVREPILQLRLQRHSKAEQGNLQPHPANRLRFRIGANAQHVGARLNGHRGQRLQPMSIGIRLTTQSLEGATSRRRV